MIILDTCILIFDALNPQQLTAAAKKTLRQADENNQLCCCDISLWEIAMLIQKKRIDPGTDIETFLTLLLQARNIEVLPITSEIASLSALPIYKHVDPADRLIAATAMYHKAKLITADQHLRDMPELMTIW